MEQQELWDFVFETAREIGLNLNNAQIDSFILYIDQLRHWNKTINLTAITEPKEIIVKHFIDSLTALVTLDFPTGSSIIDIGTGAGFPSIPLKIARNDLKCTLIEPNQKKISFLASVIGTLKLSNMFFYAETISEYANRSVSKGDVVLSRALRFDQIKRSLPHILHSAGHMVLYRTEKLQEHEIEGNMVIEIEKLFHLPCGFGNRVISVLAFRG